MAPDTLPADHSGMWSEHASRWLSRPPQPAPPDPDDTTPPMETLPPDSWPRVFPGL